MADAIKSFDVSDIRVIVKFPEDVGCMFWFQRLAVIRVLPDRWVMLTPDYDLEIIDQNTQTRHVIGQNTPFSRAQVAYVYAFGLITNLELKRREVLVRSSRARVGGGTIVGVPEWVVCDPTDDYFGKIVPVDIMYDEHAALEFDGRGVVDWGHGLRFVERVDSKTIADYMETRRAAYLDGYSCPVSRDSGGIRAERLQEVVSDLAFEMTVGWPIVVAAAELEVINAVSESMEAWDALHAEWLRGSSDDAAEPPSQEHRRLIDALDKVVVKDAIRKTGGDGGSTGSGAGKGVGGRGGYGRGMVRGVGGRGERGAGSGRGDAAGGAAGGKGP